VCRCLHVQVEGGESAAADAAAASTDLRTYGLRIKKADVVQELLRVVDAFKGGKDKGADAAGGASAGANDPTDKV
jgi:hypothetical protein